jgi:hypothetical protein
MGSLRSLARHKKPRERHWTKALLATFLRKMRQEFPEVTCDTESKTGPGTESVSIFWKLKKGTDPSSIGNAKDFTGRVTHLIDTNVTEVSQKFQKPLEIFVIEAGTCYGNLIIRHSTGW